MPIVTFQGLEWAYGLTPKKTALSKEIDALESRMKAALAKVWLRGDNPVLLWYGVYLLRHTLGQQI